MSRILLPVPHIRQRAPGHCLAACAAMVLSYLGLSISYDRLLKLLQIKRGIGAPASNIRRLERLGLEVTYHQGTLSELHQHLQHNTPCLAFVKTDELPYWDEASDHAVVVTGLDEQFISMILSSLTPPCRSRAATSI